MEGLSAVHAAGVTHGDINPNNIIINKQTDRINIIDFGISSELPKYEVQVFPFCVCLNLHLIVESSVYLVYSS